MQKLPCVEVFAGRGHNVHELTRNQLLDRLSENDLERFRDLSGKAATYFAKGDKPEIQIEWIYHLENSKPTNENPAGAPLPRVRLPENYVERPDALNAVKAKLLAEDERTLVVSAIAGLGGVGKSVLAAALGQDREVQERFGDGILWVTLGQSPDLQQLLGGWMGGVVCVG